MTIIFLRIIYFLHTSLLQYYLLHFPEENTRANLFFGRKSVFTDKNCSQTNSTQFQNNALAKLNSLKILQYCNIDVTAADESHNY